jgi:alpha-tubulin suppressor-like RCC1 family protein
MQRSQWLRRWRVGSVRTSVRVRLAAVVAALLALAALAAGVNLSGTAPTVSAASAEGTGHEAVAWGENHNGNLGTRYSSGLEQTPVAVEELNNIEQIAVGGNFTLVLLNTGNVDAFGGDMSSQLGDEELEQADAWEAGQSHVQVKEKEGSREAQSKERLLSGVQAIAAGGGSAMALLENGTVKTWGNNEFGQLGNGTDGFESFSHVRQAAPRSVEEPGGAELSGVTSIVSAGSSDFALMKNGTIMAWGRDTGGRLGIPESELTNDNEKCEHTELKKRAEPCSTYARPVLAANGKPLENVAAIAAGGESAYALLKSGAVMAWGANQLGQLGIDAEHKAKGVVPTEVRVKTSEGTAPLKEVVEIVSGSKHVLARRANGEVYGWGENMEGELGELGGEECGKTACDDLATPIALEKLSVTKMAAGDQFSLFLSEGKLYGIGRNNFGELGDGGKCENPEGEVGKTKECYSRKLHQVSGLEHVNAVSAEGAHAAALIESPQTAPAPDATLTPGEYTLTVTWTSSDLNRLLYRVFERPLASEACNPEEESCETPVGEGLEATSPPVIKREAEESIKPLGSEVFVGDVLVPTTGGWSGNPSSFEVQWEREVSGVWQTIGSKKVYEGSNIKGSEHTVSSEDVGHIVRLTVFANGESEGKKVTASEASNPTPVVKAGEREKTLQDNRPGTKKEEEEFATSKKYVIKEVCYGNKKEICSTKEKPSEYELSPSTWYEVALEAKPAKGAEGEEKTRRLVGKPNA